MNNARKVKIKAKSSEHIQVNWIIIPKHADPKLAFRAWGSGEQLTFFLNKVFIVDKESNLFRIDSSTFAEENSFSLRS